MSFDNQVMVNQDHTIGFVETPLFANPVTTIVPHKLCSSQLQRASKDYLVLVTLLYSSMMKVHNTPTNLLALPIDTPQSSHTPPIL